MNGEQGFESPINVCLKQGKRLKVISRLRKESLASGNIEFENEYRCVSEGEENQQQTP